MVARRFGDRSDDLVNRYGILQLVRAVVCHQLSALEHLRVEEVAEPVPGHNEVLVGSDGVGLSDFDVLIVSGAY